MLIRVAQNKNLITRERAAQRSVKYAKRQGITNTAIPKIELRYKKLLFIKILALAARTPFPPKRVNYVMFFDTIMNQGGLTDVIPAFDEVEVDDEKVLVGKYTYENFKRQKDFLLERHILRTYLLKRPEIQIEGYEEIYLPYYIITYSPTVKIYINAATGKVNI